MKKKIFLLLPIFLIFWQLSFAQEENSSGRLKHVAFSPSTSALIGVHGGILGNTGGIFDGNDLIESGGLFLAARHNNRDLLNMDRLSVVVGVNLQMYKFAYIYVGGGYGDFKYPYLEPTLLPDLEISGPEIEGGIILKFGPITLMGGATFLNFEQMDLTGGVGYTF